ncbi:GHMP family kinase ATP-binding protein [Candidatus Pelagibacter sp. HIMB123]|uniref:GHMP family kinase ATP-binding protein n=1 Tax=Candidatus Pelagibacter sp. HIMB123 TaxID=3415413 RepID=UPI003F82E56F
MIVSKTPYRIPLSGGGTDLDFYYKKNNASLLSLAINQYVFVSLLERKIDDNYFIQTSSTQFTSKIENIKSDLVRETLKYFNIKEKLHIATYATIPTRTGLGSSSAMVIGLINCLKKFKNLKINDNQIIKAAYIIERKKCNLYGGWQDQIISQKGGLTQISISKDQKIRIKKLTIKSNIKNIIENNFLLIYTDVKRDSSKVALSQKNRKKHIMKYYDAIKSLNKPVISALNNKNYNNIAKIFNLHWSYKKKLSSKITSNNINDFYRKLLKNPNFLGGKLIGSGGGGFILMVVKNKKKSTSILRKRKIKYLEFKIENNGSKILRNWL